MKATEILNQVKNLLGVELSESDIQLAELKLENGTVLEALLNQVKKFLFVLRMRKSLFLLENMNLKIIDFL